MVISLEVIMVMSLVAMSLEVIVVMSREDAVVEVGVGVSRNNMKQNIVWVYIYAWVKGAHTEAYGKHIR